MSSQVFINVDEEFLMEKLVQCRQRACYAAPGLHDWAARAFIDIWPRLGPDHATVITDPNPFVIQVGYGTEGALKLLAEHSIPVRIQPGLRIGVLIADDFAAVFGPPAYNLELFSDKKLPNAIVISTDEADRLIQALMPEWSDGPGQVPIPEIGQETLTSSQLHEIHEELIEHPPVRPDLERQMRVINSIFQIVKIRFDGSNLAQRKIQLDPSSLGVTDPALRRRIGASFKLFEGDASHITAPFKEKLEGIKRQFNLKTIGDVGHLVLARDRDALDKALAEFQADIANLPDDLTHVVSRELQNGKQRLRDHLRLTLFPGEQDAKYVEWKLDATISGMHFPTADELLADLELDWNIFHVSEQMINKEDFAKKVEEFYGKPMEELARIESAIEARRVSDSV
jgi:hypothetical protein